MSENAPRSEDPGEDAFDAIVASFHGPSASQAGSDHLATPAPGGASPDGEPHGFGDREESAPSEGVARSGGWDDLVADLEQREAARQAAEPPEADVEDDFVPPPPPPLPRTDALGTAAWVGVIGAPALWMLLSLFGWVFESWQLMLLIGVGLGSFGLLVSRMRHGPGDDEAGDNGAVV